MPSSPINSAAIGLAALGRWPASVAERLIMESRLPALDDMPPPVFILGHWRSGTTHLYNVMCQSGEWGYVPPVATGLPWDLFGIAKAFKPMLERALPEHRYIDNIPVTPTSPQEDEIAIANMSDVSFYHGIYFPRAFKENVERGLFFEGCSTAEIRGWRKQFSYFLRKLYLHQEKRPLLIKNPVYTGRFAMLREMFPSAKFIHIHRNPYDVFVSMRNFYKKLFKELALQSHDHVDIDETILSVYERVMRAYERDAADVPSKQLVEYDIIYQDDGDERPSDLKAANIKTTNAADGASLRDQQEAFLTYLWNNGYPTAAIVNRRAIANFETNEASAVFVFTSGPKATFGEPVVSGTKKTDNVFVERMKTWEDGEEFERKKMTAYYDRLRQTGLFSKVDVSPGQTSESGETPILVELEERKSRTIGAGVSYSTTEGPGGRLFFEHRNILGHGENLTAELTGSQIEQSINVAVTRPLPGLGAQAFASTAFLNETTDAYDARTFEVTGGLSCIGLNLQEE
jgi:hypothetical protein